MYSSRRSGVNPHFFETIIFWRPGNLYCDRRRASIAAARSLMALIRTLSTRNSNGSLTWIPRSDTQEDLANIYSRNSSIWLSKSTAHTSLQSIGTSTWQHLIDANDVIWMGANSKMEGFLPSCLHHVPIRSKYWIFIGFLNSFLLVGADTCCFKCFRAQLFVLVRDEMDT